MSIERTNEYSMILLCTSSTIENVKNYYKYFQLFICPKRMIVIGNESVKNIIEVENLPVEFVNEDKLYPGLSFQSVKKSICERTKKNTAVNRTGWYFQQFLKMAYSIISEEEEYLIWDSDTIPTHMVTMHAQNGQRFFDVKTEYHEPYFKTINRLFPELIKTNNYSFISEHMLINRNIMNNLVRKIEQNDSIEGISFWEKIINAVEINELSESGFSEFETYGTYCEYYYNASYAIREWKSLREGTVFFKNEITEEELKYFSKAYDAISFESHSSHMKLQKVFCHKIFRKLIWIKIFETFKNILKKFVN